MVTAGHKVQQGSLQSPAAPHPSFSMFFFHPVLKMNSISGAPWPPHPCLYYFLTTSCIIPFSAFIASRVTLASSQQKAKTINIPACLHYMQAYTRFCLGVILHCISYKVMFLGLSSANIVKCSPFVFSLADKVIIQIWNHNTKLLHQAGNNAKLRYWPLSSPPFSRLGLDPKLLAKILNMSSGRCWSSDSYNPVPGVMEGVPSANNYQGGFGTTLMAKVYFLSLGHFFIFMVLIIKLTVHLLIFLRAP